MYVALSCHADAWRIGIRIERATIMADVPGSTEYVLDSSGSHGGRLTHAAARASRRFTTYASTRIVPRRHVPLRPKVLKYSASIPDNEQSLPRPAGDFSFSSRTAVFSQDAFSSRFDSVSSPSTRCWTLAQVTCGADISRKAGTGHETRYKVRPSCQNTYYSVQTPHGSRQQTDDALLLQRPAATPMLQLLSISSSFATDDTHNNPPPSILPR